MQFAWWEAAWRALAAERGRACKAEEGAGGVERGGWKGAGKTKCAPCEHEVGEERHDDVGHHKVRFLHEVAASLGLLGSQLRTAGGAETQRALERRERWSVGAMAQRERWSEESGTFQERRHDAVALATEGVIC